MDKEKYSDFDIQMFRGHFRIASDHFENGVREFEKLQKLYREKQEENKNLALLFCLAFSMLPREKQMGIYAEITDKKLKMLVDIAIATSESKLFKPNPE